MADDLSDQWKLDENSTTDEPFANIAVSLPGSVKKGTKRKDFSDETSEKEGKGDQNDADVIVKSRKRGERKKITIESKESLSQPGTPEDLRTMMSKALKDRISTDALLEILPDPNADFYPCNSECLPSCDYLSSILPNWKACVKKSVHLGKTGSPCVLVVTSSAIRAVNLRRELKAFAGDKCIVAKLFSKHIKIEEQKRFLSKTVCPLGIGTPNRLLALIKLGVLQLESLVAVVLDWNWRDVKLKRLPDIPEVRQDLTLLLKDHMMETIQGSPCLLALL